MINLGYFPVYHKPLLEHLLSIRHFKI